MKRNIIISDLDGTIIKHNDGLDAPRSILAKDKECIHNIELHDDIFIVSTGRNFNSVHELFQNEHIDMQNSYYITSNGAQIYDGNGKLLYSSNLDSIIVKAIVQAYQNTSNHANLIFHAFDGIDTFVFDSTTIASKKDILFNTDIINLCIYSKNDNIQDVEEFLHSIHSINASVSQNNWFVDVLPNNVSKASAILKIFEILGYQKEQFTTLAIGDSWNDICMFEFADHSFTFHNSPDDVKEKATGLVHHFYEAIDPFLK